MSNILVETHYLPTLEFFCAIANTDEIQIELHEHYIKQTYRSHTFINTANGLHKLIVPLASKRNNAIVKDLKIDWSQNWATNQCRTIESAYRKSPYYQHYIDDLIKILNKHHAFLVDLNMELLSLCLIWLRWQKKISGTTSYQQSLNDRIDLRNVLLSKKTYKSRNFYRPQPYTQVFGNTFVENLSLMDLIFSKGPEASGILRASALNL